MDWRILATAGSLAAATSLVAQESALGRLRGLVRDTSGTPVAKAQIVVKGTALSAITDSIGVYHLDSVPVGVQAVKLYPLGYYLMEISGIEIESGIELELNIQLIPKYERLTECLTVDDCNAAK